MLEELVFDSEIIARDGYVQNILPFVDKPLVKVFTGVRRCGKSVMMLLVREELKKRGISDDRFIFLNFESENDTRARSVDTVFAAVGQAYRGQRLYVFFDEVQELPNWEKMVNSLMIDFDVDIYLTGSNANLLSGELATYLGGRYVEIKIYPFSFAECKQLVENQNLLHGNTEPLDEQKFFTEYVVRGGFPFLYKYKFSYAESMKYISDIFNSVVFKDITQRNKIRDVGLLQKLILYFVSNIGNTFSATSVMKYFKSLNRTASTETIYNYIEYAKAACFLHLVKRQDLRGKEILSTQEKIYLTDHGMREAFYGNNMRDINQTLENIVYIELLRRGYDVTVGKTNSGEIDFCAERRGEKIYVQVAYLLATEETVEREFGVFAEIRDNWPKYVLSLDEIDMSRDGIIHKNIRDFLLGR